METGGLTRQTILAELFRNPHGDLEAYLPVGLGSARQEPDFFAHALVWAKHHGTIRNANMALPMVSLAQPVFPDELCENSLAHLALLSPRDLEKVWRFGRSIRLSNRRQRLMNDMVHRYLRAREACWPWWERTALHFRQSLATLYALSHCKPHPEADAILFKGQRPEGTIFAWLQTCQTYESSQLAGFIRGERLPFLVLQGILGARIKEPDVLAAVVDIMTPAQLTKHMKALKNWGFQGTAATRGAVTAAVGRARTRGKRDTLVTASKAAEALADDDPTLAVELEALQEAQLQRMGGIEGNWLVLGDKSLSMVRAIAITRTLAGFLAKQTRGQVLLVFFDREPFAYDVTGKTYADIGRMTARVQAGGSTCIGAGIVMAREKQFVADGIAIVSDGGENQRPAFSDAYAHYTTLLGKEPPVYLFRVPGADPDYLTPNCERAGIPYQVFPVPANADEYALGTFAATMQTNRYGLLDKIMQLPLLTLAQALRVPKQWRERV